MVLNTRTCPLVLRALVLPQAGDSSAWAVQGLGTHQAGSSLTSPDSSSGICLLAGTRTQNCSDFPGLPRLHRSGHCPCHPHLTGQGWHRCCCQLEGHGSGNGSGPAQAVAGEDDSDRPRGEMSGSPPCPNCHRAGLALVPCSAWLQLSPGFTPSIRWQEGGGGGGGAATGMGCTLHPVKLCRVMSTRINGVKGQGPDGPFPHGPPSDPALSDLKPFSQAGEKRLKELQREGADIPPGTIEDWLDKRAQRLSAAQSNRYWGSSGVDAEGDPTGGLGQGRLQRI